MVDRNGHACLAGFGQLTKAEESPTYTPSSMPGGRVRWMSPELFDLEDGRLTKESDCYGLGMVIYEVLSGQSPFTTHTEIVVVGKILEGERPERPRGERGKLFTNEIWGILELCWKHQPHDRISAGAVLLRLEKHPPLSWPPLTLDVDGDAETGSDGQWGWCAGAQRGSDNGGGWGSDNGGGWGSRNSGGWGSRNSGTWGLAENGTWGSGNGGTWGGSGGMWGGSGGTWGGSGGTWGSSDSGWR